MDSFIFRHLERGGDGVAVKIEPGFTVKTVILCAVNYDIQLRTADVQAVGKLRTVNDGVKGDDVTVKVDSADFI
jgi:hypothetical protein